MTAQPIEPAELAALFAPGEIETLGDDPGWRVTDDEQPRILHDAAAFRAEALRQAAEAERPLTEEEAAVVTRIRMLAFPGQDLDEFLATGAGDVTWFGPIVDGGLAAFVGRPESFKSMAAVQLGLAGAAGGSWLGFELGEPRPFVYISGEKSRATIRDRLERMAAELAPAAPVRILHRAGVSFGDREAWGRVVELVAEYGPRTFVVCDTIASLAGPGFDENSGRDMATVLAALRQLGDAGATVAALHHPSKHGDGTGGIRLRGHTSLWGEIDCTLEFTRPDRSTEAGIVRIEPKDGDLALRAFRWDRTSFLVEPETAVLPATSAAIAAVVDALYQGDPLSAERIRAEFPGHGRTVMLDRLGEAVSAGLVARVGRGKATGYVPVPRAMRPDESDSEHGGRTPDVSAEPRTIDRGTPGRSADEGIERGIVRGGGSIGPPPDDPQAGGEPATAWHQPCLDYQSHRSRHRMVEGRWTCDACSPPSEVVTWLA